MWKAVWSKEKRQSGLSRKMHRVGFDLKAWRWCLWQISSQIDCTLVVAHHISSSLSRWYRNLSWQMTMRDYLAKGNANLIFRIYPPLLHDCYWIEDAFRWNAICDGNEYDIYRIASTRILCYCSCNIENDCAVSYFNIIGYYIYARIYLHQEINRDKYQFNGELIVIFALNGISNDPAIEIYIWNIYLWSKTYG